MNNPRTLAALVLLNVVLMAAVLIAALSPQPAEAQLGAAGEQYLLIAGRTPASQDRAAVYVLNVNSGQMVSLTFDSRDDRVRIIGGRDVSRDLEGGRARGR